MYIRVTVRRYSANLRLCVLHFIHNYDFAFYDIKYNHFLTFFLASSLLTSLRGGKVGIKSSLNGSGYSENHGCFNASDASILFSGSNVSIFFNKS